MFWLKSGRFFGDIPGGRRTESVALGLGASGTMGVDGPCPIAHAGKQAIVQIAITSTPRMEIHCRTSNMEMCPSEDFNRGTAFQRTTLRNPLRNSPAR